MQKQQLRSVRTKSRSRKPFVLGLVIILALLAYGTFHFTRTHATQAQQVSVTHSQQKQNSTPTTSTVKPAPAPATTACSSNAIPQLVLVSISKQHMWACAGSQQLYDSPVVTGMENLPADLTPVGTYKIYAKETNLYLNGSDSTGSWHDYVYYWMPFLNNQYGTYGFHDATWRSASAFGNISPYSSNGSHGCVEMPLATSKWLFNWANIGTTVTIEA